MATMITSECINCGACEPECPNQAIYQGGVEWQGNGSTHPPLSADYFYIVPEKCTECVGFFEREACAAVCPVDCCVPNPDLPETEAQLIERSRRLHPGHEFSADFPSRFRTDDGAGKTPAPPPVAAPPSEAPTVATAPAAPSVATTPPVPAAPKPAAQPASTATAEAKGPAEGTPAAPVASPAPVRKETAKKPSAAASAEPPAAEAPVAEEAARPTPDEPQSLLKPLPPMLDWEIALECFRCAGGLTVRYRHLRSGLVLRCPHCGGSFVVNTELYGQVSRALEGFHDRWDAELDSFRRRRDEELQELRKRLREIGRTARPAGAPRKPASIFG